MVHRLETVDASLLAALAEAEPAARRRVSLGVATWVVERAQLRDDRAFDGLAALADGGPISPDVRLAVQELTANLDEAAWNAQDQIESGEASDADLESAFGLARAAIAVLFALDEPDPSAAAEVCYEAQAAFGEISDVRSVALASLAN